MATVKVIPPRTKRPERLRVAAYCRVSSDSADQLHSYATQIRSYTEYISQQDSWELVDIYADEGLTGTRIEQRTEFQRMMADCRRGKIDRILVKSISRFSRNTKDCLTALRELAKLGVTVKFEKENIDTGTLTTELMVSVSGSLAQQESISISQNQRMSYQRRMAKGEFITCHAPYGYTLCGKELRIDPEQAKTVQWIFGQYLAGWSSRKIADELTRKGVPSGAGNEAWSYNSVQYILKNEKNVGDTLCQKTYSMDCFPFVRKENSGQREQYYVENSHPGIVSREDFARVQELFKRRAENKTRSYRPHLFSRKIICGKCGSIFTRRSTASGYTCWVCRNHDKKSSFCEMGRIKERCLYEAFQRMYQKLKCHEKEILEPAQKQLHDLDEALKQADPMQKKLYQEIAELMEKNYKLSKLYTSDLLDADAYIARSNEISAKLSKLQEQRKQNQRSQIIWEKNGILAKSSRANTRRARDDRGDRGTVFQQPCGKNRRRNTPEYSILSTWWNRADGTVGRNRTMNKRSILYGYQIQNGVLEIVAEEQAVVQQVFERYHAGGSYQSISEELNQEGIPFSLEAPRWNKHKVKRVLEEVRYTGEKDYPPLIDQRTFQAIQEQIKNKTARSHRGSQSRSRQRLRATACRQNLQEYQTDKPFERVSYLQNAIDRAMEAPEDPEEILDLILQAISARYACCPTLE